MAIPVIGSKWNGKPQDFIDTQNGIYWQSMPTLDANEIVLQRALLAKQIPFALVFDVVVKLKKADDVLSNLQSEAIDAFATGRTDKLPKLSDKHLV